MRLSATIFFSIAICVIACKKSEPNKLLPKDYRQDYLGHNYAVVVNYSANSGSTTYNTILNVAIADSIIWENYSTKTQSMLPGIKLIKPDGSELGHFGIDSAGNLYTAPAPFEYCYGGFIGKDSINTTFGFGAHVNTTSTTIEGHRVP